MDFRRTVWVMLLAGLVTMLVMTYLQKHDKNAPTPQPAPASSPAAGDQADAAKPLATRPAAKAPAAPEPAEITPEGPKAEPPGTGFVTTKKVPTPPDGDTSKKPPEPTRWQVRGGDITSRLQSGRSHDQLLGSLDPASGYKMQIELTSIGAAISRIKLSEHFATVADKRRFNKDSKTYLQAVADDPKLKGHYELLKPREPGMETNLSLATHQIFINGSPLPLGDIQRSIDPQSQRTKVESRWWSEDVVTDSDGTQRVTFFCRITRNDADFARIEKTYSLAKGSHSIDVELRVVNLSGEKFSYSLVQFGVTGLSREELYRQDNREVVYGQLVKGDAGATKRIGIGDAADAKPEEIGLAAGMANPLGSSGAAEPGLWIANVNKFFAGIVYVVPAKKTEGVLSAPEAKATFFNAILDEETLMPGLTLGVYDLEAGATQSVRLDVFAGAKIKKVFDDTPRYDALNYTETLSFRSCFCASDKLALGMMWLLGVLSKATLGNYGWAIILMVFLVRLALHPITKKGQMSMAKMQKIAPEMAKLKEKYKDDKAKMNEEVMKLYKTQGVSPFLGCLPMLLQMPIWIALFTSISASAELRHAAFLPVWITDLAVPDKIITFSGSFTIPLIGGMMGPIGSFNLLPLLLCVAMYLQTKLNPQMSGAASPEQQSSQRMMKIMMPAMMLLFFYNMPSGLNLYIMASTSAGVIEQIVIRKHIRDREEREAAMETKVAMPGKYFRGKKPKKPKGPFQVKH